MLIPYFKSAVAFFFLFFLHGTSIGNGQQGISYNLFIPAGFNVKTSYLNQDNKALFVANYFDSLSTNTNGYAFGNSFNVVYDDLKTWSVFGELKADFTKNIAVPINPFLA